MTEPQLTETEALLALFKRLDNLRKKATLLEQMIKSVAKRYYDSKGILVPLHLDVLRCRLNHELRKAKEEKTP